MKTTVEIPDALFRRVKSAASGGGLSLHEFLTRALREKLAGRTTRKSGWPVAPPKLPKGEAAKVQSAVDREFSRVHPDDWQIASRDLHFDRVPGLRRVGW